MPGAAEIKSLNDVSPDLEILLVCARRLFAEAIARSLATEPHVHILGIHSTVTSLRAERGSPDVVLAFGPATDGSATEVIRAAKESWPDTALVAAPNSDGIDEVIGLIQAGADGYLPQSSSLDDVLALVERAGRGDTLLPA